MKNTEKFIKNNMINYKIEDNRTPGGQSCGKMITTIIGEDKDLGIEIKCSYFKSQYKNRELIEKMMNFAKEAITK